MSALVLAALVFTVPSLSMEAAPSARLLELDEMSLPELRAEHARLSAARPRLALGIVGVVTGGLAWVPVLIFASTVGMTVTVVLLVACAVVALAGAAWLVVAAIIQGNLTSELRDIEERMRNRRDSKNMTPPPLLQSTLFTF